jgi:hypothetical protein
MRALLDHGLDGRFPRGVAGPAQLAGSRVMAGFARRWMGDEMADRLEIPRLTGARLVPLLRPAAKVRDLVRATGILGGDERVAALEIALVRRAMAGPDAPDDTLDPADAADEPVLEAVA